MGSYIEAFRLNQEQSMEFLLARILELGGSGKS